VVSDGTRLRDDFLLDPSVTFLNHGSFGATPRAVFETYQEWQLELERQPVLFLARRLDALLADARSTLGAYVGADADDLVFVPNASTGVNVAAWPLGLEAGDEVLSTDLEYGALDLAWEHVCGDFGARYVRTPIRLPVESSEEAAETIWARVGPRTKVLSSVTTHRARRSRCLWRSSAGAPASVGFARSWTARTSPAICPSTCALSTPTTTPATATSGSSVFAKSAPVFGERRYSPKSPKPCSRSRPQPPRGRLVRTKLLSASLGLGVIASRRCGPAEPLWRELARAGEKSYCQRTLPTERIFECLFSSVCLAR
jgi:aminotransferase class V